MSNPVTVSHSMKPALSTGAMILSNLKYTGLGILFGIVFIKSEVISWFRIQEMFHFQSFHMFGIIGSAIVVGMVSIQIIKRFQIKALNGEQIHIQDKKFHWGNVWGGLIFGLGWAITGACPGPLFAQIGFGYSVVFVTLLSAIGGTWFYGYIKEKLPN